jgi:hypothetical protein
MTCHRIACTKRRPCTRCARREASDRVAEAVTWFERTDHCHGCGQPGAYCLCTEARPCGCAHLHVMGSGVSADPAVVFGGALDDGQHGLFDDNAEPAS